MVIAIVIVDHCWKQWRVNVGQFSPSGPSLFLTSQTMATQKGGPTYLSG